MKKTKDEIQQDALEYIKKKTRIGIAVSMGVGKTLIGLKHFDYLTEGIFLDHVKLLVVAPKRSIFKSWKDDAKTFNLEHILNRIEFTTYLSLPKLDLSNYYAICLDECHSLKDTHDDGLRNYKGFILGMTGTPPKSGSSEKGMMVAKYCPIDYYYITDNAIEDKILNNYQIYVHSIPLSGARNIEVKTKNGGKFYRSEKETYKYWTDRIENSSSKKDLQICRVMRMKAMMEFKSKEQVATNILSNSENKCILFANTQDQADRLCEFSYHSGNSSSENNLEDFKQGTIKQLSCVLQLNEGVNIPNLKEGIIMHSYGNERKLAQRIGRLLRLNPEDTAIVHILCFKNTVDTLWVTNALEDFDDNKIIWL
jgi:superfamily II DNA or RNA helicase